ncbi:hypothetical protein Tco_1145415 [Tanacetum coccineum]
MSKTIRHTVYKSEDSMRKVDRISMDSSQNYPKTSTNHDDNLGQVDPSTKSAARDARAQSGGRACVTALRGGGECKPLQVSTSKK